MSDDKKRLCPDPDCAFENEASAEKCATCGLDLEAYFSLDKIFTVREKVAKAKPAPAPAPEPEKKGLASLWGKRGKK